ncbi:MAG: hypothetical protein R2876_05635 [Eubacteriales bacterium]
MVFVYYFFTNIIVDNGAIYVVILFEILILYQIWWFLKRNRRKIEGILYDECDAKLSLVVFNIMNDNEKNYLLKAQALAMTGDDIAIDVKKVPIKLLCLLLDIYVDIYLNTGDVNPFLNALSAINEEFKKGYLPKSTLKKLNKKIQKSKSIVGLSEDKTLRENLINKELNTTHIYRRVLLNLMLAREAIRENNLEEAKIRLNLVYDKAPRMDASNKAKEMLKNI